MGIYRLRGFKFQGVHLLGIKERDGLYMEAPVVYKLSDMEDLVGSMLERNMITQTYMDANKKNLIRYFEELKKEIKNAKQRMTKRKG